MAISLYDASVPSYLQTLQAVSSVLALARSHCADNALDLKEIVETRVHPDMLPFRFQIQSVVHHSKGAMDAIRNGTFHPPGAGEHEDYEGLETLVREAHDALSALAPDDVDSREDSEVLFEIRGTTLRFTAADFLLSFSLPNLHFHATTAYTILRAAGVPLGKRNYLGHLRLKT